MVKSMACGMPSNKPRSAPLVRLIFLGVVSVILFFCSGLGMSFVICHIHSDDDGCGARRRFSLPFCHVPPFLLFNYCVCEMCLLLKWWTNWWHTKIISVSRIRLGRKRDWDQKNFVFYNYENSTPREMSAWTIFVSLPKRRERETHKKKKKDFRGSTHTSPNANVRCFSSFVLWWRPLTNLKPVANAIKKIKIKNKLTSSLEKSV